MEQDDQCKGKVKAYGASCESPLLSVELDGKGFNLGTSEVQVSRGRNGKDKEKIPYEYLRGAQSSSNISFDDSMIISHDGYAQVPSALLRLLTLKDPP